jgi:probable H4MPT-linked C1 transfer pathway protein
MANVIGLDIGGANTKAVFLHTRNGHVEELKTKIKYFPIWKNPEELHNILLKLKKELSSEEKLDGVGTTMTAELADAYQTKRQGVNKILASAAKAFDESPVFVLNIDATLIPIKDAKNDPLSVAAANWTATGWLVSQLIKTCIIVDVGSTTTSIIPLINGQIAAAGKNDLEKLIEGELIYSGSLRTNVAAIVKSVPIRGKTARVASELFALSGDVHLILNHISDKQYTTETADSGGKTRNEALARLARLVCSDMEMLTEEDIIQIAKYVNREQVKQIAEGLSQVHSRIKSLANIDIPVVVTGLGKDFLAKTAAESLGVDEIIDLERLVPKAAIRATPAAGVALMTASKLEEETVKWTP